MNKWLSEQSHKVNSSSPLTLFKSYFLFGPGAVIVGSSNSRKILNKEFSEDGISQPVNAFGNALHIFGKNSMSFETKDKSRYRFLRSLVAQSMTHETVAEAIGALQKASESVIDDKILADAKTNGSVEMEKCMKHLTLGELVFDCLTHYSGLPPSEKNLNSPSRLCEFIRCCVETNSRPPIEHR